MLISIIIPAFNEEKEIAKNLERIQFALKQNYASGLNWEIIVCDNNSSDDTAQIATKLGAQVVFEADNQISKARNTGASIAKGDWFIFIDADSYPPHELITEVLQLIESQEYIGCGSTIKIEDGPLWNKLRMEWLNPLMQAGNWCGGAFLVCEAAAFRQIGGFSEDLYALEEIDFVRRLKKHGRRKRQKFCVLHKHPLITSGRKGELSVQNLGRVFASNFLAIIFLALYLILPKPLRIMPKRSWLKFWYKR